MNPQLAGALAALRRYPYSTACVLLTLLLGGAAWYLRGENEELAVTLADRTREGEAMLKLLVGGSTQRQELALVQEAVHRIDENLIVESNLAENTWYFYKFEEQARARLAELHQLNSPSTDASPLFCRVPYTLRVSGGFDQVAKFLHALETGPRLVKISAFSLTRAGNSAVTLDLNLEMLGKK